MPCSGSAPGPQALLRRNEMAADETLNYHRRTASSTQMALLPLVELEHDVHLERLAAEAGGERIDGGDFLRRAED